MLSEGKEVGVRSLALDMENFDKQSVNELFYPKLLWGIFDLGMAAYRLRSLYYSLTEA